jgi:hypothetical protein
MQDLRAAVRLPARRSHSPTPTAFIPTVTVVGETRPGLAVLEVGYLR